MPLRSVQITLVNNTPFALTEYRAGKCHGSWAGMPPATVGPNGAMVQWQSQDDGIFTGTEGWVKYTCPQTAFTGTGTPPPGASELVYIHWDNPYIWGENTNPIDPSTSISNISAPCDEFSWPGGASGTFATITPGKSTVTQLFAVSNSGGGVNFNFGTGPVGEGFTILLAWPAVLTLGFIAVEHDINLEFTLGLRMNGSTRGSINHFYDGSQGLRTLAVQAQQPSLRQLFKL
jgi:hypothetical protein